MQRVPTTVTTTSSIEGWDIEAYLGPVAVHRVAGTGLLSDIFADFSDFFGGRSDSYRHQLESLYSEALTQLLRESERRGGNWVVGFKADFDEISGKQKQMFMLVVVGTAVRARKQQLREQEPIQSDQTVVGGLEVKAVVREHYLLHLLEHGPPLAATDWEFLAERQLMGAVPAAVAILGQKQREHLGEAEVRKAVSHYLHSLPAGPLSDVLFDLLWQPPAVFTAALALIEERRLGRLDRVRDMFRSESADARWAALQSLKSDAQSYGHADLAIISELLGMLPGVLLPRPTQKRERFLGGDKEQWQCMCGKWVSPGDPCDSCYRNQMGIGPTDLSPDYAMRLLHARHAALRSILGR